MNLNDEKDQDIKEHVESYEDFLEITKYMAIGVMVILLILILFGRPLFS